MIKDLIVSLQVSRPRDLAAEYAVSIASAFEAHVSGVAFAYEPVIEGSIFDGLTPSLLDSFRAESVSAARKAQENFESAAKRSALGFDTRLFSETMADSARAFGRLARSYDLSIVGQAMPDDELPERLIIEAALFDSGRPVLIVPYIHTSGFKVDKVMVCWDGSRSAARAIADAMPLLKRAGAVDVVTIEEKERTNEIVAMGIGEHLARHGINVEVRPVVDRENDVASTVLSMAADASTDLVVMGGFGHSWLRDIVLGGATQGMLKSMTVPTLMAH